MKEMLFIGVENNEELIKRVLGKISKTTKCMWRMGEAPTRYMPSPEDCGSIVIHAGEGYLCRSKNKSREDAISVPAEKFLELDVTELALLLLQIGGGYLLKDAYRGKVKVIKEKQSCNIPALVLGLAVAGFGMKKVLDKR